MIVEAVIEIPTGSQNKYEMDHDTGRMRLDRVLFSPFHYPADYGFVPDTLAEDGDPLDIVVLISQPTFPGCALRARIIGLLEMRDEHGVDDKLFAVAQDDPRFDGVVRLDDLPGHTLKELVHFFSTYKELQGLPTSVGQWQELERALEVLDKARSRYRASEPG
ncbi:MAG: inorganic diphosphatase [Firmicutes bacterium]|jgi:inorganic pyrophosphatase|nr:inorganic diphosphatase [Bacillota bacterium]